MSENFGKLIQKARKAAGLTQEQAAERIGVSVRTLAKYESYEVLPTDHTVARMIHIFNDKTLGYTYFAQETEVGCSIFEPIPEASGIAAKALQYHLALLKAIEDYRQLESICCDDRITLEEKSVFSVIAQRCKELAAKAHAIALLADFKAEKKGRPVLAGRSKGK